MVLARLLVDYEFKLENPTARPSFSFGKARLPNPFTTLLVRRLLLSNNEEGVAPGVK